MYAKSEIFYSHKQCNDFLNLHCVCVKIISGGVKYLRKQCSIFNQWQWHCHDELKIAHVAIA